MNATQRHIMHNSPDGTVNAVIVVDQPDRETRPLAVGVGMTLVGYGLLALGATGWQLVLAAAAIGAGALVTAYGIARVGR